MSSSLEESRRKQLLMSIHKRSLLSAFDSDDSTSKKRPITTDTASSSPYKVRIGRARNKSFTKRRRKSVTPKSRKSRRLKSSEHNKESSEELQIFDRRRREVETSGSEDTVILYQSPKRVRRTQTVTRLPTPETPMFLSRANKDSKRNLDCSERRPADALLRDVPAKYLTQIGTTISDTDEELHPKTDIFIGSPSNTAYTVDSSASCAEYVTLDKGIKFILPIGKDSICKTYKPHAKKGRFTELLRNKNNLTDNVMSRGTSDRMWEEFVSNNYDKIVKYLKPVSTNDSVNDVQPFKEINRNAATNNLSKRNKGNTERIEQNTSMVKKNPRNKTALRPKTTKRGIRRGGKKKVAPNQSENWEETSDEYSYSHLEDVQFEKGGKTGGRMSLAEFRKARKVGNVGLNKNTEAVEDLIEFPLNVDENWKKSEQVSRHPIKLFASDSNSQNSGEQHKTFGETGVISDSSPRKRKIIDISNNLRPTTSEGDETEVISPRELRKIHRMRKYAMRLKMNQTAVSLEEAPLKIKQERVESRASTSQIDLTVGKKSVSEVKLHSKMQSRNTDKNKPRIKSIEVLKNPKLKKRRVS